MKSIKNILFGITVVASTLLPGKLSAQTPTWYQAFNPRNEVVDGFNSYGIPDLNNNKNLKDDLNLILGSSDPKADVDGDGNPGTSNDVQVYTEYVNGNREYLPGEYWRSTPSEKEGWVRKVAPIIKKLNNYTYNNSSDSDKFFDSDRFALGGFFTTNGYNPNRDDFNLIHSKYNMTYNGLFNLPFYIARVHSDDGNFNHGLNAIFTGNNLNDLEHWLFFEPQTGEIVEPGSFSIPFNSRVDILGVQDFETAYNVGLIDLPLLKTAASIHFDSQGNREITYMNPVMIEDQTTLGVEDNENTNVSNKFLLKQNFPNPFNSNTTISYYLPKEENVELNIYSSNGQKLETLVKNEKQVEGEHKIIWDAEKYPAGIYLYQIQVDDFIQTKKMLFVK